MTVDLNLSLKNAITEYLTAHLGLGPPCIGVLLPWPSNACYPSSLHYTWVLGGCADGI